MTGMAKGGTRLAFGEFGIQALEPGWLTNRQIEAARMPAPTTAGPLRPGASNAA